MPFANVVDPAGVPVPGSELNFYLTTSNTRAATYADFALTVPNANPVVADDAGRWPDIFLDPAITYKVVLTTASDPGPAVEIGTYDPVVEAWFTANATYFDQPFEFLGGTPPLASEVMGLFVATRALKIYGNFDGTSAGLAKAHGKCLILPTADFVITVNKNTAPVGTITINHTTGVFTFATTAGAEIDLAAGDYLEFIAQVAPDATIANVGWTVTGIAT
jgi:hypothetical protein